jgi:dTDP-4-dehydrorhamnose reductase
MRPKNIVSQSILIVGASGTLGVALMKEGGRQGLLMRGTVRNLLDNSPDLGLLDLERPLDHWVPPGEVQAAIICAAVTKLEVCRRDPLSARRVNVTHTLQLIDNLLNAGIFVIFVSSGAVFDGSQPLRRAGEPTSPKTEYGRHKAEVETALSAYGDDVAVVRLTKVADPRWPLLRGWINSLKAGQNCRAFTDYVCAPIPLETTALGLLRIAEGRMPGIWQFSADSDLSYFEIARHAAAASEADLSLVVGISAREQGELEHIPRHTSLDDSRARLELNLAFPPPLAAIQQAFFEEKLS